ncbi:MAG: tetratricopeptide repeat protein [Anaerolineae bacterium]|nr:tetratricopeptide repeat protein [Anaerolineae bacterium]
MSNQIEELEGKITKQQTLLNLYEDNLRLEDDPRRRLKLQENIDEIKTLILGYQTQLARTRQSLTPSDHQPPTPGPQPPTTFLANAPYGLETALVGREDERLLLDDWYSHDTNRPLLAVIGLGGMGKSALTWDWLQKLKANNQTPPLVVWWSFYETDGTMNHLMVALLKYFGDSPRQFTTLRAAATRVIDHLRRTPALLMLDGAERLLRAYSGLAAAYQGDEDDPTHRDRARQCTDPVSGQLLEWLTQPDTQARTLLTSRLFPLEFAGRGGTGLQGVRRHDLTGLSPTAAHQLFRSLRIRCTRAEVEAVGEPLGYHPLSLRLLARTIAVDPHYRNDIKAAVNYDPSLDLLGRRQHVLSRAYETLSPSARDLLGRLAAFRSSVPWEIIIKLFGNRRTEITTLERRGLVQRTELRLNGQPTAHYDLHPIVRRYAYSRLTDPTATHTQLVIYFEAVPEPERVRSLDDLRPTIELYHHLVHAGRYDEAHELFRDRLTNPLYFQLGAYRQCIELLRALFPDGEDQPPRLSKEDDQGWTLAALANSYSLAGQPAAAIPLFEQQIAIREKQGDKKNLAIGLGNLANSHRELGNLRAAADNLRRRIALCREIEDRFNEAIGHHELGRVLAYGGDWAVAKTELETALEQFTDEKVVQSQGLTWAYRALAALLQGQAAEALAAAQEAYNIATNRRNERDHIRAEWLIGWATLAQGQLDTAQTHLDEALRRCRAINMVDHEPSILLARARLAVAQANPAQAQTLAAEARLIAERAGYVLNLADIHNLLAQLALDGGDRAGAREHAEKAKRYAWCDGPPYYYKVAYEEAERLLGELGM